MGQECRLGAASASDQVCDDRDNYIEDGGDDDDDDGISKDGDGDVADGRPVSAALCAHLEQPGETEVSCRSLPSSFKSSSLESSLSSSSSS